MKLQKTSQGIPSAKFSLSLSLQIYGFSHLFCMSAYRTCKIVENSIRIYFIEFFV